MLVCSPLRHCYTGRATAVTQFYPSQPHLHQRVLASSPLPPIPNLQEDIVISSSPGKGISLLPAEPSNLSPSHYPSCQGEHSEAQSTQALLLWSLHGSDSLSGLQRPRNQLACEGRSHLCSLPGLPSACSHLPTTHTGSSSLSPRAAPSLWNCPAPLGPPGLSHHPTLSQY